jgi:integrase
MKEWKWKINRKAAYVLIEVADSGRFRWSTISQDLRIADEGLEEVRGRYLFDLKSHNLQPATISLHDYVFRFALGHARITTLFELRSLSPDHIRDVVTGFSSVCSRRSLSTILPIVRKVLDFLYEEGFVRSRLSGMVMGAFVQRGNVAAYISPDDEEKLLVEIERGSRRDKAIVLLLLRLGLRECDICELTLQEIEWQNDRIGLVQKKTGRLLALPLLPDVGNALMDYITEERPNRDDGYPYVFLRKQAPYNRLSSLYHLCSGLAKRLKITPVSGHTLGAHLYRYTLVHRLLNVHVPHQVITDILGHASKESDKPYLSMEESMLRACALDLSVIGKVSWGEAYNG